MIGADMLDILANVDPMTLSGALATGIAGLSACVVHLYKTQTTLQRDIHERVSDELSQCQRDRQDLWSALIRIDPKSEELRKIK